MVFFDHYRLLSLFGLLLYTAFMVAVFTHKNPLIGLDIQPDAVRLAAFCQSNLGIHLSHADQWQNLESFAKEWSLPCKAVAIAVPYSKVHIKRLTIEKSLKPKEIEILIRDGLASDFLFGWQMIDSSKILVVSCPKEALEPSLSLLKQAQLLPSIIDVDLFAIERVFYLLLKSLPFKTIAAVYIHQQFASLSVFQEQKVIFRQYNLGGEAKLHQALEAFRLEHLLLMTSSRMAKEITEQLTVPFSIHHPAQMISITPTQEHSIFHQNPSDWTVACGLALRAKRYNV